MNSKEYRDICNLPNVLPRDILEDTMYFLAKEKIPELEVITHALMVGTVEFPVQHHGDLKASYHKVTCSFEVADKIADLLFEKEAESVPTDGTATTETSRLVTLVNIWHELADYME